MPGVAARGPTNTQLALRVETAIASGKKADAEAALKAAQPELHSGVSKGVLHKNAAARKISRLTKRIRAL